MGNIAYSIFKGLMFLVVFGSILFIAYVTTRYVGNKTSKAMKGKYINVVESVSMGIDKQIHLLRVGEQFVLISSSGKSIEFLTTLKMDGYEVDEILEDKNVLNFKSFFERYVQTFKGKKDVNTDMENSKGDIEDSARAAKGDIFKSNLNRLKTITTMAGGQGKEDGDERTYEK